MRLPGVDFESSNCVNFLVALEYEEIDRGTGERAALDERTRLGLERGFFARRPLSWAGVVVVLIGADEAWKVVVREALESPRASCRRADDASDTGSAS